MKNRLHNRRVHAWIGAGLLVLLCFGAVRLGHYERRHGPLYQTLIKPYGNQIATSSSRPTRVEVVLGSYDLVNTTSSPITILRVEPTNVPDGVHASFYYVSSAPMYGAADMDDTVRKHLKSFPVVLPPNDTIVRSQRDFKPECVMSADRQGVFDIAGALVTYTWRGRTYTDYFPSSFVLNTTGDAHALDHIPTPPSNWP